MKSEVKVFGSFRISDFRGAGIKIVDKSPGDDPKPAPQKKPIVKGRRAEEPGGMKRWPK